MTVIEIIRLALMTAGWIPAVFFPVWYHFRMRWQDSEMGRHVMGYSVVVAAAFTSGMIFAIFKNYPGQEIVRLVLNFFMAVVVWWRMLVFMHLRRAHSRKPDVGPEIMSSPAGSEKI